VAALPGALAWHLLLSVGAHPFWLCTAGLQRMPPRFGLDHSTPRKRCVVSGCLGLSMPRAECCVGMPVPARTPI
jgi:hypothetical protein